MSRRITITIENVQPFSDAVTATVAIESNTGGPGAVDDHLATVARRVTAMWSTVEPHSAKPKVVRDVV